MATAAAAAAASLATSVRRSASRRARLAVHCRSDSDGASVYKELGLYSLKKRIEDAVVRVEMAASSALEVEEARRVKQEEALRKNNLWDDPSRSHESLSALARAIKVVDRLKDLRYKAEEAKLISQLVEKDVINGELLKQAYTASLDACEFLDRYEMSKLLKGPYDKEGACIVITVGSEGVASELWAEKLFSMYTSWAQKHGCKEGLVEKNASAGGHIWSAAIEIESEYMFGYLYGEKGIHRMICPSLDDSGAYEALSARVDIIPLFLDRSVDFHLDETDLEISPSPSEYKLRGQSNGAAFMIRHIPSGLTAESSGERSCFANKLKALNRLKAKLLVLIRELSVSDVKMINKHTVEPNHNHETRRYTFGPQKSVHDLNTGVHLSDLNSVLDGDIEPFIRGCLSLRHG